MISNLLVRDKVDRGADWVVVVRVIIDKIMSTRAERWIDALFSSLKLRLYAGDADAGIGS